MVSASTLFSLLTIITQFGKYRRGTLVGSAAFRRIGPCMTLIALCMNVRGAALQAQLTQNETKASVGDSPADPGPLASDLSPSVRPAAVREAMKKVADWQNTRIQNTPSQDWTFATLYVGMLAASDTLHDPRYRQTVLGVANHYEWTLGPRQTHADDQAIGQAYWLFIATMRNSTGFSLCRPSSTRSCCFRMIPPNRFGGGVMRCSWPPRSGLACHLPRTTRNTWTTWITNGASLLTFSGIHRKSSFIEMPITLISAKGTEERSSGHGETVG